MHRIFFLLLLVLLPTQLGYHFWPEWAHVLGRRVDYLSPTIYLTDILIFLTLAFWFIESGKTFLISSFKFLIKRRNTEILIFVIAFVIANIIVSKNQPAVIYKLLKVLEFVLLGFYIIKTKPAFSFIIWHLSFGILFSSVLAISQFFFQHSIGGPLWWLGERTFSLDTPGIARIELCNLSHVSCRLFLRPYATFPHPNVLGGFLAATIPLVISNFKFLISNQTKKVQMFQIITIVLGSIALVLTGSRTAIFAGAIGIGITYFVLGKRKRHSVFSLIPYIIPLMLLGIFLSRTIGINDESVVVRQQLNAAAIKLWQQSPIVGVGLGNFLVGLPKALPSRAIYFLQPVHNIYLLVLAETGVMGLVVFLWMLWMTLKKATGDRRQETGRLVTCCLSLVVLLLLGLVDHYPLTLQQGQLLFTLLLSFSMIQ
ncbi:O-antigen ligase family protein [Candidatus Gottesmanbacteria bacterium]|nr:O-antigen ligase family protein [Candidatus Gottesmanbacteria bacterium]